MKKVLIVSILALLGVATFPSFHTLSLKAADTLPAQYTDAEFWHFVNDFSEPGGNFQYENFVSKLDTGSEQESPAWLGKLDSGGLKLKVAVSIVAISAIHLLRIFMNAQGTPNDKILWYVVLHLTFVVSAVLLGVLDRISSASHRDS